MVGVIHPAASIVKEKERGTIEQLLVTPIRRLELLAAKLLPTLVMSLLSLFPSLGIELWFQVPMHGSLVLFFLLSMLFLFSSMGIGVFIATVTSTLQQALLLAFFGLLPIMFLSGTLVPIESMPLPLQYLSYLSPLRHYMDVILGIFLKGVGLETLWKQVIVMGSLGAIILLLSIRRFQQRME